MKYVKKKNKKKSSARTGTLVHKKKVIVLPKIGLTLRTKTDCNVILDLINQGYKIDWLNPLTSQSPKLYDFLNGITYKKGPVSLQNRPIVIADPESEALSMNCIARKRYIDSGSYSAPIKSLFKSSFTAGKKNSDRKQVHSNWKKTISSYGYSQIVNWAVAKQRAVKSDFFFSTPPVIRAEESTVDLAAEISKEMILSAKNTGIFDKYSHHFLVHPEIFDDFREAKNSLRHFLAAIQDLLSDDELPEGCSISMKLTERGSLEHSSDDDPKTRQNFAYALQEICQHVQNTGVDNIINEETTETTDGSLSILQNIGLGWALGSLDAGIDIPTIRISGKPIIEKPIRGGIKGKRDVPAPWDHSKLCNGSVDAFKIKWNADSAFPTPPGVNPEPYWELKYGQQLRYSSKLKAASAIAISEEYTSALLDEEVPLKDALLNRIKQSEVKQELMDLCPSLW